MSLKEAKCNACQANIKLSNAGPTNLKVQLAEHPAYQKQFGVMENAEEAKKESMIQGLEKFVVRDQERGYLNADCGAHMLNSVVNSSLFKNAEIKPLLESCRKLVGDFNHSILAKDRLKKEQISAMLPLHSLLQIIL
uniref:Uncharacterized protein n=1 Tax=Ditylenchus dipsaci TaxID=166011 RepID=A0A915DLJ1_9BILA